MGKKGLETKMGLDGVAATVHHHRGEVLLLLPTYFKGSGFRVYRGSQLTGSGRDLVSFL